MPAALSLHNLCVSVGRRMVVENLNAIVEPGERVALLGASGSGKSVTSGAIMGSLPPHFSVTGRLTVAGVGIDPALPAARRPAGIAAVHQDSATALNPLVSVGRQLRVPLRQSGFSRPGARQEAARLLAAVGMDDPVRILSAYAGELSGGQVQRVCIALALACRSRLLVADEPTTAQDTVSQALVLRALTAYSGTGAALLFITHDVAVAASLCHRVLVMQDGHVVESGAMDQVLGRPHHPYTQALVRIATGPAA